MRIVIDMQGAQTESRFRGIGRYTLSFVKAVVRNRGDHEIILVLNGLFPETLADIRSSFKGLLPQENILVWHARGPVKDCIEENENRREQAELIREFFIASLQPDLVHISSLFEGYVDNAITSLCRLDQDTPTPISVTLYDLIPLLNPEQYLKPNPRYQQYYQRKIGGLEKAAVFLGISEFSRNEAQQCLAKPDHQFINVSTAIEPKFQPQVIGRSTRKSLYGKFGIKQPFILYAGGADERKNLPRLIEAYAALPAKVRSNRQLVFAGRMPEGSVSDLRRLSKSAGLGPQEPLFTDYVTDDELIQLYNLCHVFVFPSWHEGFGLPALEAMACGAPVIGANTSSLPEVIGADEALFNPHDTASITSKLELALTDDTFRAHLKEHGLQQSKKFCWNKSAETAIDAWEEVNRKEDMDKHAPKYEAFINLLGSISRSSKDDHLRAQAMSIERNEIQVRNFFRAKNFPDVLRWRIEGPFDSSYSLALVNREIARALHRAGHEVALHSTEGPGDFAPNVGFLGKNPDLAVMHERSETLTQQHASITSRFLYPPRVDDMECQVNALHAYGWEESGFPHEWEKSFNKSLDGMTVMSKHVKKVMIDAGVSVPIEVCGLGIDHWDRIAEDELYNVPGKAFRFLHVSSCFPRKGVEIMLRAYGRAFRKSDDVTLIVKTFANPHNDIHHWLAKAQHDDSGYPDVLIIEEDLSDEQLKALYSRCHALVAPSYAEGFGLPMAEAMLSGLAVITTGWSGQTDFCTKDTAWLIDYSFEYAETHFELYDSVWARPCEKHLAKLMHEVHAAPQTVLKERIHLGQKLLRGNFTWDQTSDCMVSAAHLWVSEASPRDVKLGVLSTWNTKCGIATYTDHLLRSASIHDVKIFAPINQEVVGEDSDYVRRMWSVGKSENRLLPVFHELCLDKTNLVFIQFNYGFFNHPELSDFVLRCKQADIRVVITLHSTVDPVVHKRERSAYYLQYLKSTLEICDRILVHSIPDMNRLKSLGVVGNVALIPHGVNLYHNEDGSHTKSQLPIVSTYGFCLPNKGLLNIVKATALLRDAGTPVRLKLVNAEYPAPESASHIKEIAKLVAELDLESLISTEHRFLTDEDAAKALSESDLVVFAYQSTGESASGAVRYGLSCTRPVLVTPSPIFSDLQGAVFKAKGFDAPAIAESIALALQDIKEDSPRSKAIRATADAWRLQHDYEKIGKRISGMFRSLLRNNNDYEISSIGHLQSFSQ